MPAYGDWIRVFSNRHLDVVQYIVFLYILTYKYCTGILNSTKRRFLSFKCSSARRIVLLCIKEEDLAAAWEELGDMQRGCDFDLCARNIKICHGTDLCKSGQRNSVALGLKLDALC